MKSQSITLCLISILVFIAGCSNTEPQTNNRQVVTHPTESNKSVSVLAEDINGLGREDDYRIIGSVDGISETENNIDIPFIEISASRKLQQREEVVSLHREMNASVQMAPQSVTTMMYDKSDMVAIRPALDPLDRENYAHIDNNPIKRVLAEPVSTFSIDVDTGSYAVVRRMLNNGQLPRHDAVRSEELINYFSYAYSERAESSAPFVVHKEIAPSPWNKDTHLLHIGIKGFEQDVSALPPANLVFLVDVSGSMQDVNKLELLKTSLKLLTKQLRPIDSVSIVVYAGASGVVLEPTSGNNRMKIITALDRLHAGGSTNGAAGIELAYAMAEQAYKPGGINRVLLATDGDFNVGTVDLEQLKDLIKEKRRSGIALSTLGFGEGNYNDALMEQIADIGNGNYAYIDTLSEARKILVDEIGSTMLTIAKDVKIQIEFNPAVVAEYRLIGYENRALNREDFNNDKVDAGEIGAGHTVTAIYEIALVGSTGQKMDPLRYQPEGQLSGNTQELAFLRLRYKQPESDTSQQLEWGINRDEIIPDIANTTVDFRFSAAVAAFGQLLRGGEQLGNYEYKDILKLARMSRGNDDFGYRGEFISLVGLADLLAAPVRSMEQQLGLVD
jgi:Ca-activated chloride channel homolog